jgi:hypothetical protein
MPRLQKFTISFFYSELLPDGQKRLRVKESKVDATDYEAAEWKVRREYLAKGIEIKVFRIPSKT